MDTSIVVQLDVPVLSGQDTTAGPLDTRDAPATTDDAQEPVDRPIDSSDGLDGRWTDAVPAPVDGATKFDLAPVDAGAGCTRASDCESGFCVRGVCCDRACNGACEYCPSAAGSKTGTCIPAPTGLPSDQCPAMAAATCGTTGLCDGKGACATYAENTMCQPGRCVAGVFYRPSVCNGRGQCSTSQAVSCYPYGCSSDGAACASLCSETAGLGCMNGQDAGTNLDGSSAGG